MKYKVGIIGFGKMGQTRKQAIDELNVAEVVAISEPNLTVKCDLPNVSHDEIINDASIDTIIVCTPNNLNKQLTIRALNAGKHVFCEKPPAFTAQDVKEIRNAEFKSNGKKLMYGFNHRHHDSIIRMKEIIDSGDFGNIIWMRGRYGKSVTEDYFKQWRAKKEISGGGIVIDQGIHMLDLFRYLGGEFDSVKAEVTNHYWKADIEDNAFIILKNTQNGLVASLHSTMTQWRHLFSLEVFMDKGYMVLNGLITSTMSYGEETLSIAKNRSAAPAATWKDEVKTKYLTNNSWRYEMEHFFKAIKNNTPITIGNSNDAFQIMRIIDEIYKQKDF
jgi:1,5-anhydro-D-fructose reductase (1,5-anhydro-D-mannitol-forming)